MSTLVIFPQNPFVSLTPLLPPQLLTKIAFRVDPSSDGAGLARMLHKSCCSGQGGEEEKEKKTRTTATQRPQAPAPPAALPVLSLPPPVAPAVAAAAATAAAVPIPPLWRQKNTGEAEKAAAPAGEAAAGAAPEGLAGDGEAGEDPDLDLDLGALAALSDDDQLAALLENMLRGDELFRMVFERVDGAVAEALMAAGAVVAAGAEAQEAE